MSAFEDKAGLRAFSQLHQDICFELCRALSLMSHKTKCSMGVHYRGSALEILWCSTAGLQAAKTDVVASLRSPGLPSIPLARIMQPSAWSGHWAPNNWSQWHCLSSNTPQRHASRSSHVHSTSASIHGILILKKGMHHSRRKATPPTVVVVYA